MRSAVERAGGEAPTRETRRYVAAVLTHYQRLLNYIVPDVVHVLSGGRIVKTGGNDLARELEARGYAEYQEEAAA